MNQDNPNYGGPEVARSVASGVGHLFANQVGLSAQHIAIQDGDRQLTYSNLDERVRQLARVLQMRVSAVATGSRYYRKTDTSILKLI